MTPRGSAKAKPFEAGPEITGSTIEGTAEFERQARERGELAPDDEPRNEEGETRAEFEAATAPLPVLDFVDGIARVCHEGNRALCLSQGDASQPLWEDAPQWQKESARAGVLAILEGRVTRPEQSHESWSAQKVADGWVYGPVKDAEAKTHPCLVPYTELPPEQRIKDSLFLAIVRTLGGIEPDEFDVPAIELEAVTDSTPLPPEGVLSIHADDVRKIHDLLGRIGGPERGLATTIARLLPAVG